MHIEEQFQKEISAQSKLVELYKVCNMYLPELNKIVVIYVELM